MAASPGSVCWPVIDRIGKTIQLIDEEAATPGITSDGLARLNAVRDEVILLLADVAIIMQRKR